MFLINSTILFLSTSNLLASPLNTRPITTYAPFQTFSKLFLSYHFANFINYIDKPGSLQFKGCSFSRFLKTPVKIDGLTFFNSSFSTQKTISTPSDVNFVLCRFTNCQTKNQGGAIYVSSELITKFALDSTTFYNCSAMINGAISIKAVSVTMERICFNLCTASVSNQAGTINSDLYSDNSFINFFRCPTDQNAPKNFRGVNSFVLKSNMNYILSFVNSSFNRNRDHGCITQLQNSGTKMQYSNFVNNSGVDGFSVAGYCLLILAHGTFVDNQFSVAPFDSPRSSAIISKTIEVSLLRMIYLGNAINPQNIPGNHLEGNVFVTIRESNIDAELHEMPFGKGASYSSSGPALGQTYKYTWSYFVTGDCAYVYTTEEIPKNEDEKMKERIVYALLAGCGLVVVIGLSILCVIHVQKKKSLDTWIADNEHMTSKQTIHH
ncbi:hypothetical protein TRFO_17724 [Tritrichomonas foetus]|uniref:Right handed beta helix domain-containing protein n=1 Tax=Tritrichomonas foetus TaxID=1144522 RepID=A0A1J4KNG8_9EUKA|nr:hypothetical protein TRFO_17724 [Tritrichomonas foetus]|eukprot:OHT12448.1 hypothetical protein TRFO_17724 [Tritrichomonas foetus]